ncbi:hypothetical protein ACN6K9_004782 [Streptomyces sp. SAS_267]|uniref:hypothetical protein n=1 Tax=Streptomyces sp. NPDC015532 TaxID=3364960 RepID=UPI0036FD2908
MNDRASAPGGLALVNTLDIEAGADSLAGSRTQSGGLRSSHSEVVQNATGAGPAD